MSQMKLLYSLKDNQYEDKGHNHTRSIVRAVVYDDFNRIALTKINAKDIFGLRDYYELPGGGVNQKETLINALKRELDEELGAKINNIVPLGRVVDFYNLINRKNNQHYYLCHVSSLGESHQEERELQLIEKIVWVDIDTAISLYETMQNELVGFLVKQRELPILKIAKAKMSLLNRIR